MRGLIFVGSLYGHIPYNCSNRFSSRAFAPRTRSITDFAPSKYSCWRSIDASAGGLARMSRRLQILSASLTSFAADEDRPARETCSRLGVPFFGYFVSVTSSTIPATRRPNAPNQARVDPAQSDRLNAGEESCNIARYRNLGAQRRARI
jgi:hypothetical protein